MEDLQQNGGILMKRGFLGMWSERFCKLLGTQLIVCKEKKSRKVEQTIDVTPSTRIDIANSEKCRFKLETAEEKTVFQAPSNDEMMKWVLMLRSVTFTNPDMSMDNFDILSVIGRGYYGKVMMVRAKQTNDVFAIKSIRKSKLIASNKVHTVIAERNIMTKASHPFIVPLKFAFQTKSKFYLGLEYVPGGDLFSHIRREGFLCKEEVKMIIIQVALALHYLHSIGIVYRDLKPENILFAADGYIKLADFGLAKDIMVKDETDTFCGTSDYIAPEMIKRLTYDKKIDWWMLGILTYELLYHKTPFSCGNKAKLYQRIIEKEPRFPETATAEEVSFISGLLEKDPNKRAEYEFVHNHPFTSAFSFDAIIAKQVQPLFIPQIEARTNTQYFDAEFTEEDAADSFCQPVYGSVGSVPGFSYVDHAFGDVVEPEPSILAAD